MGTQGGFVPGLPLQTPALSQKQILLPFDDFLLVSGLSLFTYVDVHTRKLSFSFTHTNV